MAAIEEEIRGINHTLGNLERMIQTNVPSKHDIENISQQVEAFAEKDQEEKIKIVRLEEKILSLTEKLERVSALDSKMSDMADSLSGIKGSSKTWNVVGPIFMALVVAMLGWVMWSGSGQNGRIDGVQKGQSSLDSRMNSLEQGMCLLLQKNGISAPNQNGCPPKAGP